MGFQTLQGKVSGNRHVASGSLAQDLDRINNLIKADLNIRLPLERALLTYYFPDLSLRLL